MIVKNLYFNYEIITQLNIFIHKISFPNNNNNNNNLPVSSRI